MRCKTLQLWIWKYHHQLQKSSMFIYSEKAKKLCEIFTLLLTTVNTVKSKMKILQNFVAFSEYMNFYYVYWKPALVHIFHQKHSTSAAGIRPGDFLHQFLPTIDGQINSCTIILLG